MPEELEDYRKLRRFDETPEPDGSGPATTGDQLRFVVQEHHATRLHWDLRLEHDGALASWAIPNGIPDNPARNRKAIRTEDHPLDYLEFFGTIPAGNYGAGEMSIWDHGTFSVEKWRPDEVMIVFDGQRLHGRYVLFRAGKAAKDWMIHRMDPPADPSAQPIPAHPAPMLAQAGTLPRDEAGWAFEVKWDGVRAIVRSEPGRLHAFSRSGREITDAYPELHALNTALGSHAVVLDGELIAFDAAGRQSFQAVQQRIRSGASVTKRLIAEHPVTLMIFDLLWQDGHSLETLPYEERRARLEALQLDGAHWQVPPAHVGAGRALLAATAEQGLEGVIAKELGSPYTPGARSSSWLKLKHVRRQEVVVGGWTPGRGGRSTSFGALQVGVYDADGSLRYAGGVGSGFSGKTLTQVQRHLSRLARKTSPFEGRQPPPTTRFVTPSLVIEVEFAEWTEDGSLRHARFKGLRSDKPARAVVREATPAVQPDVVATAQAPQEPIPKLTNRDKVLYPKTGTTKGDVIDYYGRIAPVLVPHLRGRALTLKRFPDGVEGKSFFEKHAAAHRPDWIETVEVDTSRSGKPIEFVLAQNRATLLWTANLAAIELHPSLSRAERPLEPTALVFDLDPGSPATIVECCEVGLLVRELLAQLNLQCWAKTSGSKGLQVYAPLNVPITYDTTKPFAHALAALLEERRPELVVSQMKKTLRPGKVLIDWSQNDEHKTTVAAYSMRARPEPTVSTPVTWDEVAACRDDGDPKLLRFTADEVLARVAEHGDLFAPLLDLQQELPELS